MTNGMDILITELLDEYFFDKSVSNLGLSLICLGQVRQRENTKFIRSKFIDSYGLVIIKEGGGYYESSYQEKSRLEQGHAILLFPGVEHRFGPENGELWHTHFVLFDGLLPKMLHSNGLLDPKKSLVKVKSKMITAEFNDALKTAKEQIQKPNLICGNILKILNNICAVNNKYEANKNHAMQLVARRIEKNITMEVDLKQLAKEFNLSYSSLRKQFKDFHGISPKKYFSQLRMKHAGSLLSKGLSVKEVCFQIGMEDPYHFSRLFKQHMGKSPKDFKDSITSWIKD